MGIHSSHGLSCHITNNKSCLFEVIINNKLIQDKCGIRSAIEKGKLHVWQVNGTEWFDTPWPMKFCTKAGATCFPSHVRENNFEEPPKQHPG